MKHQYCVILAGGIGARLWPASRQHRPKQFIDFLGTGKSLLQTTYERYARFIPADNILVVSNHQYADVVQEQLPQLPPSNLLLDPIRRNTTPSVVWATLDILRRCPEASMVVTPVDHFISQPALFEQDVQRGLDYVTRHNRVLSVGVEPTRPETSYGYIQMGKQWDHDVFAVKSFTEKPDSSFATLFVENREFLWNTGLFLWHAQTFIDLLRRHEQADHMLTLARDMLERTDSPAQVVSHYFSMSPSVSLEQVLLERGDHVDVLRARFGWADLGTWDALFDVLPKDDRRNATTAPDTLLYDCSGCIVKSPRGKLVVIKGLQDYMVVDEGDVLVVCPRDDQRAVRRFVNDAQMSSGEKFV